MILLLFDVDGTLTATTGDDDRLFAEAVREVTGYDGPFVPWEQWGEVTDPAIARAVIAKHTGRRPRDADVMTIRLSFVKKWEQALTSGAVSVAPIAGALDRVQEARNRKGFVPALVSGGWGPSTLMKLHVAGFPVEELCIVTADECEDRPAIMRSAGIYAAAARGCFGFSQIVLVGDGVWDARAARAVRAGFVGIAPDEAHALKLRTEGAAAILPDLSSGESFWSAIDAALAQLRASAGN